MRARMMAMMAVMALGACTDDDVIVPQTVARACADVSSRRIELAVDLIPASGDCFADVQATCTVTATSYTRLTVSTELRGMPIEACDRQGKLYTAHCSADLVANVAHSIEIGDLAMTVDGSSDYADPLCVQP